jgi:hypothetical protein
MKRYSAVVALIAMMSAIAFWGCKNGNMFGGFHKKGSGDTASLLSDAKAALSRREFNNAKAYYESIVAKEPRNSEALYGAATSSMGTAGLDLGTLLSNVITAKTAAPSGALAENIQLATIGVGAGAIDPNTVNSLSILKGLDLNNLSGGIDQIVCFLLKIRSGNADGKISPEDISVLLSVGITCIIRGILRPLEQNLLDLRQTADGKDFTVVIIDGNKLGALCADGTVQNSIRDLAGALQSLVVAVNQLAAAPNSSIAGLKLDMKTAFQQFQTKFNTIANANNTDSNPNNNVPASCMSFVNSFDPDNLTPPTLDPGDCLNKSVKPIH